MTSIPPRLDAIQKRAIEALQNYAEAPEENKTDFLRTAAEAIVDARGEFFTGTGEPDWLGRSNAYRRWLRETTLLAGFRGDEVGKVQGAVRYHTGNALRERLDDDTLRELGLLAESPRERSNMLREKMQHTVSLFSGGPAISEVNDVLEVGHLFQIALRRMRLSPDELNAEVRRQIAESFLHAAEGIEELVATIYAEDGSAERFVKHVERAREETTRATGAIPA